jgi:hypothetical protein
MSVCWIIHLWGVDLEIAVEAVEIIHLLALAFNCNKHAVMSVTLRFPRLGSLASSFQICMAFEN